MALHIYVVDSSARRHQIKTAPATYLRDVLEEACRKLNRDPNQYSLQDSSRPPKTIDLASQIRHSGLVSGAKLQLVQQSRSAGVIAVALQLPDTLGGGRLQDRFPSDTSLWLVLRKFEEGAAGQTGNKLNITQRGRPSSTTSGPGTLDYEQPAVHIMGRDFKTFVDLQKTLMQLGFNNGSVLLRLSFFDNGLPMHVACEQISQYFDSSVDSGSGPSNADGAQSTAIEDVASTPADQGAIANSQEAPQIDGISNGEIVPDTDMQTTNTLEQSNEPIQQDQKPEISIYKAPSELAAHSVTQDRYDPEDYIPTVEHAKSHQATLNKASRNQRLLSDAELAKLEQEKQSKLASIQSTTVRVRLPDQMMIDINITHTHTQADIYEMVRSKLASPDQGFQLRHTGSKGSPITLDRLDRSQTLIRDLGFTGRILLTMVWDVTASASARSGAVLRPDLRAQAVELKAPGVVPETKQESGESISQPANESKAKNTKLDVEAKMKKLLGFGKKK